MIKKFSRAALGEFLFWFHLVFIVCAVLSGLVLPLVAVVAAVILHRLHTYFFDGCALSAMQKRVGGLPREHTFLQDAARRLFGRTISPRQSSHLDLGFAGSCLMFAVARQVFTGS